MRWWLLFGVLLMTTDSMAADPVPGVSRELARQRSASISELRYLVRFELQPDAPRINGEVEIRFSLRDPLPVVIDFRDTVRDVKIGAIAIDVREVNGHIVIPKDVLSVGENAITIRFETAIAAAGRPLTRYQDRDDGNEYVYSLFVPMDASLAFPCFDQPDLKAKFTLEIVAPTEWEVIANTAIQEREAKDDKYRRTRFRETRPISTYLFAFAAGPFVEILAEKDPVPLRVFARKSQVERAKQEAPEILRLTREGMKHMIDYFAQPFPFEKYDSVLIPGFPYGGMEHAGASFFREDRCLFRTAPTDDDRMARATLILHELAHQWFGDFVTMRWFDDLWLKEGFAEYMAYHALASILPPETVWKRFYQQLKPNAYAIDVTAGTTPIYQEITNLNDAKSAYGAIVYSKAPSLLRSLAFVIGEDKFRDGVRLFLKEHAYGNAEWSELISAFETASGQKLQSWADAWVLRPGLPRIEIDWSVKDGKIDSLEIRQRDARGGKNVWPVRAQLLLAYDNAEPVRLPVSLDGERTIVRDAIGKDAPVYILANDQDHAYGLFLLDERSRRAVGERIAKVRDPFLRSMLWGGLWDAVREAEMAPREFITLVMKSLQTEDDESLTQTLLSRAILAYQKYLSSHDQRLIGPMFERFTQDRMLKSATLGMRVTYFRAFRSIATTPDARTVLKSLLSGKLTIPDMELKPLDRWQIITALISAGDGEELFAEEKKRDTSDDGRKYAWIAESARPDAAAKKRYFADFLDAKSVPEDWVVGALRSFNATSQSELTRPFLKPSLEALPKLKHERKIFFVLGWLNAFLGGQHTPEALDEVKAFLRDTKLEPDLERKVLEVMDELERTVRIRAKFGK